LVFFFFWPVFCAHSSEVGVEPEQGSTENASMWVRGKEFPAAFHLFSAYEARSHIALALFPDLIPK